jgi:hypothetical protein
VNQLLGLQYLRFDTKRWKQGHDCAKTDRWNQLLRHQGGIHWYAVQTA